MTKEALEERRQLLQAQIKQIELEGNKLVGALMECEFWLVKLQEQEDDSESAGE